MILNKRARAFYAVSITTDAEQIAPAGPWEASFDGGTTWVAGEATEQGTTRWLVRGADFDPTGVVTADSTLIAAAVSPLLRAIDNPEVEIQRGPAIILVT